MAQQASGGASISVTNKPVIGKPGIELCDRQLCYVTVDEENTAP